MDEIGKLFLLHQEVHPFLADIRLDQAALRHATWMAKRKRMTHIGEKRSTHATRIHWEGFVANGSAENIAMGYKTPSDVMTGWMNSKGHRRNIEAGYDYIGLACVEKYWCVVFANSVEDPLVFLGNEI